MVSGEHNLAMQLPSPTMKQPAVSDQSLSKNHISVSPKANKAAGRSRRKNSGRSSLPSAYDHMNTNSPYYKGLTDQSLAIPQPKPQPQPHTPTTTDYLLSSPYYKGLLALGPWTPHNHPIPFPPNYYLSYPSSPYYRGLLTDYTLVLHASPPPPFSNLQSSIKTNPGGGGPTSSSSLPNIKTDFTLEDLIIDADFLTKQSQVENYALEEEIAVEEIMDQEKEAELEEMVIEEKPLRESVLLEEETMLLEEKEMMGDEEKPLRERVSETSDHDVEMEEEEELKDCEKEKKALPVSVSVSESESESQCEEGGNLYQYTWAAKYQPMSLDDFICNKDKALQLKAKVKEGCGCSHFIFEGPPSVGKRSMIRAMLREVFGADRVQVIEECRNFNLKGEMVDNLQVRVKKSLHHVEVNLSETKGYEKHVIVDLFKETYGQVINNSEPCCPENCKAIILYEAEKLSIESLLYIKWLLEKYKGCNKVFFCCSDESKLQPVKPLCITVQLSSPSTQELVQILENIGKEEGIKLSRDLVEKIILRSKNNQCQAIRSLEATCRNKDAVKDDDLILTGWEEDILNIAKKIIEEQSPRQ